MKAIPFPSPKRAQRVLRAQRHGDTRDLLAQQRKKMNDNIQYSPPHRQREAREREKDRKDINEH